MIRKVCPSAVDGWCGLCYQNLRGRSRYRGHRWCPTAPPRVYYYGERVLKKPLKAAKQEGEPVVLADPYFPGKYPLLAEHLIDETWSDGSSRETSSVTFRVEDGRFNLALNDRALKQSAYVTADSLETGLASLEKGLRGGNLDWRPWGSKKTKK